MLCKHIIGSVLVTIGPSHHLIFPKSAKKQDVNWYFALVNVFDSPVWLP